MTMTYDQYLKNKGIKEYSTINVITKCFCNINAKRVNVCEMHRKAAGI